VNSAVFIMYGYVRLECWSVCKQ